MRQVHNKDTTENNQLLTNEVILSYQSWQHTIDAGGPSARTIKQHTDHARAILKCKEIGSLSNSLDQNKICQYMTDRTHDDNPNKIEPSSAATYLFSLHSFYSYLLTSHFENFFKVKKLLFPMTLTELKKMADNMIPCSLRYAKHYQKASKVRAHIKYEAERELVLTLEERRRCMSGKLNITVKQIMSLNTKEWTVSETQAFFTLVRNYLMLNIFVRNGHRTGVVSNMTTDEFMQAKLNGAKYMIKVLHHKTNREYGHARVIISKPFYRILQYYQTVMRPCILSHNNKKDHGRFFMGITGNPVETTNISKMIKSTGRLIDIDEKKLKPQMLRKSTSTAIIERNQPGELKHVTDLMLHTESTAIKKYGRTDKEKSAMIGETLITGPVAGDSTEEEEDDDEQVVNKVVRRQRRQERDQEEVQEEKEEDQDQELTMNTVLNKLKNTPCSEENESGEEEDEEPGVSGEDIEMRDNDADDEAMPEPEDETMQRPDDETMPGEDDNDEDDDNDGDDEDNDDDEAIPNLSNSRASLMHFFKNIRLHSKGGRKDLFSPSQVNELINLFSTMLADSDITIREPVVKKILSGASSSLLKKHSMTQVLAKIRNMKKLYSARH